MLVDCYFDLSLGNFCCARKMLGWIQFDSVNLSEMFNPCQRYLPSTEETAERFIFRMPLDPQRPVSNELAWTSWVEMITFCTGGRMGKEVENGQSIFLECREEQGQRKLQSWYLIWMVKQNHIVQPARASIFFSYWTFRLCSSSEAKRRY